MGFTLTDYYEFLTTLRLGRVISYFDLILSIFVGIFDFNLKLIPEELCSLDLYVIFSGDCLLISLENASPNSSFDLL